MLQDVTMPDVLARVVLHPEPNRHAGESRNHDHIQRRHIVDRIEKRKIVQRGIDREPPHLCDNKVSLMDMKRMIQGTRIENGPLLDGPDFELRHHSLAKLFAIDIKVVDAGIPIDVIPALLETKKCFNIRDGTPQRVFHLVGKHRQGIGHGIALDHDGRQNIVQGRTVIGIVARRSLLAAPPVDQIERARVRRGLHHQAHTVARSQQ